MGSIPSSCTYGNMPTLSYVCSLVWIWHIACTSQRPAVPQTTRRRSSGSYSGQQSTLTTDTANTVSVRILSHSHSSFWDPRMVRISLNRSHHLTHHTVVLLIDSIHAEKVTHLKLLLPHQSFLPPSTFFPAASFYSSCVHCYLCAVFLSSTDVIYSSNSSYWTVCHISWIGWMDSLHLSPLSLSRFLLLLVLLLLFLLLWLSWAWMRVRRWGVGGDPLAAVWG